jgi:CRISPR-associated protein Cmr4
MIKRNLLLFTRTPLHVGAGASVGAIDQPIQRERHTGFPIIPGSSIKGSLADHWKDSLETGPDGKKSRGTLSKAAWLFGAEDDKNACAGVLSISEARLLAFPIRSARGGYAWITCPLLLQRASRDGLIPAELIKNLQEPKDQEAQFRIGGVLDLAEKKLVLEEYCFLHQQEPPKGLAEHLAGLLDDELWKSIAERLVVLSNGSLSHFALTTCEVAQHVRISDETGTAKDGALFNQENVPADTLFYSALQIFQGRKNHSSASSQDALEVLKNKIDSTRVFQFGGDASTGHGFCSVFIH